MCVFMLSSLLKTSSHPPHLKPFCSSSRVSVNSFNYPKWGTLRMWWCISIWKYSRQPNISFGKSSMMRVDRGDGDWRQRWWFIIFNCIVLQGVWFDNVAVYQILPFGYLGPRWKILIIGLFKGVKAMATVYWRSFCINALTSPLPITAIVSLASTLLNIIIILKPWCHSSPLIFLQTLYFCFDCVSI